MDNGQAKTKNLGALLPETITTITTPFRIFPTESLEKDPDFEKIKKGHLLLFVQARDQLRLLNFLKQYLMNGEREAKKLKLLYSYRYMGWGGI